MGELGKLEKPRAAFNGERRDIINRFRTFLVRLARVNVLQWF